MNDFKLYPLAKSIFLKPVSSPLPRPKIVVRAANPSPKSMFSPCLTLGGAVVEVELVVEVVNWVVVVVVERGIVDVVELVGAEVDVWPPGRVVVVVLDVEVVDEVDDVTTVPPTTTIRIED
ncbi:MAG: hypothetical protein CEN91_283 [Candidatus Berkelbacteria bacterium Licking1014_85]|uniref:Uncharacterized protein n=1 Tax=Candidatus Berkelbacteria bacterium Licking1014_85 TaxID=2017148 RepID=A0A554LJV8_9BACT|nr:MAG: hypothetical protein CEN91_283 [Candidatus Berkelbacteria bacterium Licking1014_85]